MIGYDQAAPGREQMVAALHELEFKSYQPGVFGPQRALDDTRIRSTSPRLIRQANITLNCAMAVLIDHLYSGATAYAEPYRQYTVFDVGQRLFGLWQEAMRNLTPRDEYDLVDEYARVLRLQRWYEWVPDEAAWVQPEEGDLQLQLESMPNPELLKEK